MLGTRAHASHAERGRMRWHARCNAIAIVGNLVHDPRLMKRAASPSFRARTVREALERAQRRGRTEDDGASRARRSLPCSAGWRSWRCRLSSSCSGCGRSERSGAPSRRCRRTERAALYVESLAAFETACAPPRPGLTEHCHDQATFLAAFEECGVGCRDLVTPLLRWRGR